MILSVSIKHDNLEQRGRESSITTTYSSVASLPLFFNDPTRIHHIHLKLRLPTMVFRCLDELETKIVGMAIRRQKTLNNDVEIKEIVYQLLCWSITVSALLALIISSWFGLS